jgi:RNA polymerase sigma-70 factor, ECF subfamily
MGSVAATWEAVPESRRIAVLMERARVGDGSGAAPADAVADAAASAAGDPDVALMLRVQGGDEAAYRELFRKHSPRVFGYARRLVGSDARAEEVVQDVFVQVFRFRTRYRPEARFSTWLYKIVTNFCLNDLRRPERRRRVDLWAPRDGEEQAEGPQIADPTAVDPEAGAAGRELAVQLEAALAALPPKQRAAMLLSRMDGLNYEDVAATLGCTEGAVKALVFRATQTLKATLKEFL